MLDAQQFVDDGRLGKVVDKIELGLVEGRRVETDQLRRGVFEHPEKIVAVVAADIGNAFAVEIEVGTQ